MARHCVECGHRFASRRSDALYCGRKCSDKAAARRALRDEARTFWRGVAATRRKTRRSPRGEV